MPNPETNASAQPFQTRIVLTVEHARAVAGPAAGDRFVAADVSGFSMRLKTRPIARPSSDCRNRPAISNLRMRCIRGLAADSPRSLSVTSGLLPGLSGARGPVWPLRPGYHTCFIRGDIRNKTETVSRLDRHLTY